MTRPAHQSYPAPTQIHPANAPAHPARANAAAYPQTAPAYPQAAPAYPPPAAARPVTTGQPPRQVRPAGQVRAAGPRLHIDWTACDGRGACTELLPELLGRDVWGYPVPRDGSRDPVVPDGLAKHAQRAVDACPVLALRLLPRR